MLRENRFSVLDTGRCLWITSYKKYHKESLVIDPEMYYQKMQPIKCSRVLVCLALIFLSVFLVFGPIRLPAVLLALFMYLVPIVAALFIRREIIGWP